MGKAKPFVALVPHMRDSYRKIRNNADPVETLKALRPLIPTGIERNHLERCIDLAIKLTN